MISVEPSSCYFLTGSKILHLEDFGVTLHLQYQDKSKRMKCPRLDRTISIILSYNYNRVEKSE